MRAKELRLVVTFHTTAESISMEKKCRAEGVPGRLIPVPRQISAGCGLAWSVSAEEGEVVKAFIAGKNLQFEDMGEYWI
ncbi:DUF3343 domain-containing protein [Clostridium sp. MCC353]|uniref:DUF3343 domain-containing protein n=1 Tax=Clostridium sp. MCC353 TaxID=2592646 RepID=UPI001C02EDD4|nr:DUF3343 domain-containing protein [Clostridium sp. MCC353]MBT9776716.1 DUF3343 domain-containing protein [Clostridium sp. MCC353]